MTTTQKFPMFERLEPRTPFQGGRITENDVLDLPEAARFASVHAGTEITPADFLRAAGRGEITMRAIVHQTARLQKIGGGVYCNAGQPNENTAPKNSILTLPLTACQHLAATGRASWREFESFESVDGVLMRFVIAELTPDEPDFETTTNDCRVTGNAVNALADAFTDAPAQSPATPAPVVTASDGPAKRSNRKPSWATVTMPYMKALFAAGDYKSAAVFYKALMHRAGQSDSPFKVVNRELYCTEAGTTVSDGSLGNAWPEIRAQ